MTGAKVLVVDSGGRGNAIAHAFARSPRVDIVYIAPGNAGSGKLTKCIQADDAGKPVKSISEIFDFAERKDIDLTFVGPEGYLSDGIVDFFQERTRRIVGPLKKATMLEGSKCDTKDFLKGIGVPVPTYQNFSQAKEANEYVKQCCLDDPKKGLVVKADGLAAGKGSIVCSSVEEAISAIDRIMVEPKLFGSSGDKIEVEERLQGRELMFFAISDGRNILPLETAMDYKQAFAPDERVAIRLFNKLAENPNLDNNPNTGGLGGFSPHPWLDEELEEKIMNRIALPTIKGFKEAKGIDFIGIIYFGLMITREKDPYVLEINVRLGDPEAEVVLPRLITDFYSLSESILDKRLHQIELEWTPDHCVGICAISGRAIRSLSSVSKERPGYPGEHYTNMPIFGLDKVDPDVIVYHNGTALGKDAQGKYLFFTTGGRVLTLVSKGHTLKDARNKAYDNIKKIRFNGMRYRKDIGAGYI